jgi:hypothetical protein
VADRGSSPRFTAFLAAFPRFLVTVPEEHSLVAQVQASLRAAAATGAAFILYTESDKELFFRGGLEELIRQSSRDAAVGAVLASRSSSSFATFPPLQRFTERTINELCARVVGVPGDYSYGPFLLNRALVSRVEGIAPDVGWGWRHFVFGLAARLGYRVEHIVGSYPCPEDQQHEDERERIHRLRQLSQNIEGLVMSMTVQG